MRAMNARRGLLLLLLLIAACKQAGAPAESAEVQLSTDLNPGLVDTALSQITRGGGARAERIKGMEAGVSALPGAAGAPVQGSAPKPPQPAALGDVRWDSEPYGAIAAAARGEL